MRMLSRRPLLLVLVLLLLGKDARAGGYSDGYLVGIDGFLLRALPRNE